MANANQVAPFTTFVVGSLPRPVWVQELVLERKAGRIDEDAADRLLDGAIPAAVHLQERAGLDYLSDGEWRRESYTRVMSEAVDGFQNDLIPVGDPAPSDLAYPAVVSRMRRRRSMAAGEVSFLRRLTESRITVALPSPYIVGWRMWSAEHSASAYATREEFMEACTEIVREEVRELAELGVDAIQLDDPDMAMLVDPSYRERMGIADVDREIELSVSCINGAVEEAGDAFVSVHFCHSHFDRRHTTTGPYDLIMEALSEMNVGRFAMEFATPDAGGVGSLRRFPADKTLGLGVIDHTDRHVETPAEVVARAERAMEHVPSERLTLNPDCGFSPSSLNPTDIDEAYLKLKALCAGAGLLREKYG
jgi:5-methyltetrahydropteroyltriglutamate--homocysteine methyltransferase